MIRQPGGEESARRGRFICCIAEMTPEQLPTPALVIRGSTVRRDPSKYLAQLEEQVIQSALPV